MPRNLTTQRTIPYPALMIPHDIKAQYTTANLLLVVGVEFWDNPNADTAHIGIDFVDDSYDEWQVPMRLTNSWLDWDGWKKL